MNKNKHLNFSIRLYDSFFLKKSKIKESVLILVEKLKQCQTLAEFDEVIKNVSGSLIRNYNIILNYKHNIIYINDIDNTIATIKLYNLNLDVI